MNKAHGTPIWSFTNIDLLCFSHLRWNFVYQRPQHLLSRFANHFRVFFIEEPVPNESNSIVTTMTSENVWVIVPHLQKTLPEEEKIIVLKQLLDRFLAKMQVKDYICWYYTPMAISMSDHLTPRLIVYDCMDELSAFKFAPPELKLREKELLSRADIVFTGGHSLYEAKKDCHYNIHPFPSSIDKTHFSKARLHTDDPLDQARIPHPRFGYYGVIDERMNVDLIAEVAVKRPAWQFVIIGPVVKIDPAMLPRRSNIHYLGSKNYKELPDYLGGWDIAMIPFALNESTRFISPTKTPEYLAAGKPVISSSIKDVVRPYGENRLVHIADTPEEFIQAAEAELKISDKSMWLRDVDDFLSTNSWDMTWRQMMQHIQTKMNDKYIDKPKTKEQAYV